MPTPPLGSLMAVPLQFATDRTTTPQPRVKPYDHPNQRKQLCKPVITKLRTKATLRTPYTEMLILVRLAVASEDG